MNSYKQQARLLPGLCLLLPLLLSSLSVKAPIQHVLLWATNVLLIRSHCALDLRSYKPKYLLWGCSIMSSQDKNNMISDIIEPYYRNAKNLAKVFTSVSELGLVYLSKNSIWLLILKTHCFDNYKYVLLNWLHVYYGLKASWQFNFLRKIEGS